MKSSIWEIEEGKYAKTLVKIQVSAIFICRILEEMIYQNL